METWGTLDEIIAARSRIAADLPGWTQPEGQGIGLIPSGSAPLPEHFPVANTVQHVLPGLVAAAILGYRRGSCVIDITRAQLEAIIEMLAPAEACTEVPHPNLWLWRDTFLPALDVDPDARLVAVFIETLDAPLDGPEADAFGVALETPSTL